MAVECQETRSQHQNRAKALSNLQSRLYEQQLTAQQAKTSTMRKLQIGGANRSVIMILVVCARHSIDHACYINEIYANKFKKKLP